MTVELLLSGGFAVQVVPGRYGDQGGAFLPHETIIQGLICANDERYEMGSDLEGQAQVHGHGEYAAEERREFGGLVGKMRPGG